MFLPDFPPLKPFYSRKSLTCLVTLFCFLVTSLGISLEPVGTPQTGCQCSQELQASQSCCCSRAKGSNDSGSKPRSCCLRKQTKSCCVGKVKQIPDETSTASLVAACGCGGAPAAVMQINQDPRLMGQPTLILSSFLRESCCPRVLSFLPDHCFLPETPPPELCSL